MKRMLILIALLAMFIPETSVIAGDASPYVVGQWKLKDLFADCDSNTFTPKITPVPPPCFNAIVTNNTEFNFQNPTHLTLQLEYAFFDLDGTFCGCDHDTLKPNGTVRYTMFGEEQGGQLSRILCPTQTSGLMKAIVFEQRGKHICIDDALLTGLQIHIYSVSEGSQEFRTETGLRGIPINHATLEEINEIHKKCVKFLTPTTATGK